MPNSLHLDLHQAELGDYAPEEVDAWFDALQEAGPDLEPMLDDVSDRLPVEPGPAPAASAPAWADRPGSGLSALHAAQYGAAPLRPPGRAAPKTATGHAGPAGIVTKDNVRELADLIWTEARGVGDKAMTAVGWTIRNRMARNGATRVKDAWGGYQHDVTPHGVDLSHAEAIARSILDGNMSDPTNGATHIYSPSTMPKESDGIDKDGYKLNKKTGKKKHYYIGGGLEQVPDVVNALGKPVRNYSPEWAKAFIFKYVDDVPEALFKFYQPKEDGPVN